MAIIVVLWQSKGSELGYKFLFLLFIGFCIEIYEKKYDGYLLNFYQKIDAEVATKTCKAEDQSCPSQFALSNQQTAAVWQSVVQDGSGFDIYGQIFNQDGSDFGNEFLTFAEFPLRNTIFSEAYNFISDILSFIDKKLVKMLLILPGAKAADIGQIAYFAGNCPDGWGDYIQCQQRFIFGAGSGYNVGDTGGEFTHTLSYNEMPNHRHIMDCDWSAGWRGPNVNLANGYQQSSADRNCGQRFTSYEGGNQPHNNMPPYTVLRVCIKLRESTDGYAKISDLTPYTFLSDFNPVKNDVSNIKATYASKSDIPSLVGYAKISDLTAYAKSSDLVVYVKGSTLNSYALTSTLNAYAKISDLNVYAKISDLINYANQSSLSNYALTSTLNAYAKTLDLNIYAKISDIPSLQGFLKETDAATFYVNKSTLDLTTESYNTDIEQLKSSNSTTSASVLQLQSDSLNQEKIITRLSSDNDLLSKAILQLQATNDGLLKDNAQLKLEISQLETNVEQLKTDLDKKFTDFQTNYDSIQQMQDFSQTKQLENENTNFTKIIEQLKTDFDKKYTDNLANFHSKMQQDSSQSNILSEIALAFAGFQFFVMIIFLVIWCKKIIVIWCKKKREMKREKRKQPTPPTGKPAEASTEGTINKTGSESKVFINEKAPPE